MDTNSEPPRTDAPGPMGPREDGPPSIEAQTPVADPTAAPATTAWVVPPTTAPPSSALTNRTMLVIGWLIGIVVVGLLAWVRMRASTESDDAYRVGVAIGAFIAPFLFAAGLRWLYLRLRQTPPPRRILASGWTPIGAALLATLSAAGNIASLAPPPPADPALAVRVGPGFTLQEADQATADQVAQAFGGAESIGAYVVHQVVGDDGSVSVMLVADGRLRGDDANELARGVGDGSGLTPRIEEIAGTQVVIAVSPEYAIGAWTEAPLFLSIYAPDEPTLRAVVESVLVTPRG